MIDWEGNIHVLKDRKTKLVLDDIPDDGQVQSTSISATEAKEIESEPNHQRCRQLNLYINENYI